jgi:uncharacterized protein
MNEDLTAHPCAAHLYTEIAAMPCINSHSHLFSEAERLGLDVDALVLFQHAYPRADLMAAGMSPDDAAKALSPGADMMDRWRLFEPFWRRIRFTGYAQCIMESLRDLYGIDDLTADTVGAVSEEIQRRARPGFYAEILRGKSNIAMTVMQMDDLVEVDRRLFLPMPRLNRFSMLHSPEQIRAIEADYGVHIGSLADHVRAIQETCAEWKKAGVAGIKMSQSYHRRMDFIERDQAEAARIFDALLSGEYAGLESAEGRLLEDYLVFACCRAAHEADLTIQFHLGMRAGNYGGLEGSTPAPMVDLFRALPTARFDLSHSGYPYLREGAVLAKTFPNVYLNMSWIHIISPIGARQGLREWLRMVPINKIIGFGDDLQYVETVYGHAKMARQNVAVVLAEMIREGLIAESAALDIARAIFYENPAFLYDTGSS